MTKGKLTRAGLKRMLDAASANMGEYQKLLFIREVSASIDELVRDRVRAGRGESNGQEKS